MSPRTTDQRTDAVKKIAIAVAATALIGTAAAAPAAIAHPGSHAAAHKAAAASPKIFKSKVKPSKNVKVGKKVTITGTHALKSTKYYCAEVISNGNRAETAEDIKNIAIVKSTAAGKVVCKLPVKAYHQKIAATGKTVHCPTTAADRRAKYSCGFAFANYAKTLAKIGAKSISLAKFTAKK
jgi:hypothetical protein